MNLDLAYTRALTLLNPWAYAITDLGKRVENRVWPAPSVVHQILIHAGKGWDKRSPFDLYCDATRRPEATSAIVAVARLAGICQMSYGLPELACDCGEWAVPGQYHWQLADVVVLSEPVPCTGRQRLWLPTADVLAAVERQVA